MFIRKYNLQYLSADSTVDYAFKQIQDIFVLYKQFESALYYHTLP